MYIYTYIRTMYIYIQKKKLCIYICSLYLTTVMCCIYLIYGIYNIYSVIYIYTQIQTICLNCFRTIALIPVNLWRLPLPSPMCVKSVHLSGWTDGGARTLYYRGKFHYSRTGNCMAAPCLMIFYISRKYIISSWPSDEHGNKLYTHVISINYIIYI